MGIVTMADTGVVQLPGDESGVEALLVLAGGWSEAALEVSVQMALIGEACGAGGFGDRLASLEQAPGFANAVGDLECVGWQPRPVSKEADEAEFADPGGGGELVEADVALGPIAEVVKGQTQGPVVAGSERRSRRADGG
jgi:hypothetical protein